MELSVTSRQEGTRTVIAVGGEIDVYTAPSLRERLNELVASGHYDLIVDMEKVEFLDSTGLGVLVGGLKRVRSHDGTLQPGLLAGEDSQGLPDHRSDQGLPDLRHAAGGVGRHQRRARRDGELSAPAELRGVQRVTVALRFHAAPEHVRTARLVAVAVARRAGMDEARLDEIRLAVGEVCARAVRRSSSPARPATSWSSSTTRAPRSTWWSPTERASARARTSPSPCRWCAVSPTPSAWNPARGAGRRHPDDLGPLISERAANAGSLR